MKHLKIFLLLFAAVLLLASACTRIPAGAEFLTKNEWCFYHPDIGEADILSFSASGDFYYGGESGESVYNSEAYDTWRYDAETETAYMTCSCSNCGIEERPIEILKNDGYRLVVRIDGEIKSFEIYGDGFCVQEVLFEHADHVRGYSAYVYMTDIDGHTVTVAPHFYDGDIPEHRAMRGEETITPDAEFYSISVTTVITDEVVSECEYKELTLEDVRDVIEGGSGCGFVWYDDELAIKKILFYGETIYFEDSISEE